MTGLFVAPSAMACSCAPAVTPGQALADATQVFVGTVVAVSRPPEGSSAFANTYRFTTTEIWKGEGAPLIAVASGNSSASCGNGFVEGETYLVYATDGFTTSCDRTRRLSEAGADLAALGLGRQPVVASAAIAARDQLFSGTWFNPSRVGEGLLVQILADGRASVYWFGYRADAPQEQTWLVGTGDFEADVLRVVDVYRPTGGGFGPSFDPNQVVLADWGEMLLDFKSDGSLSLRWTSSLPEYGSGTRTLQRLTRPPAVPVSLP
ncbi:MAG: hypothetical protein KDI66_03260 [Xanthomonadales bacterium]|nr:hypothetical protein [Xanthomonadales bacterium]